MPVLPHRDASIVILQHCDSARMQVAQEGLTKARSRLVKAAVMSASRRTLKEYQRHLRLDKTIAIQTLGTILKRVKRCDWSMQL